MLLPRYHIRPDFSKLELFYTSNSAFKHNGAVAWLYHFTAATVMSSVLFSCWPSAASQCVNYFQLIKIKIDILVACPEMLRSLSPLKPTLLVIPRLSIQPTKQPTNHRWVSASVGRPPPVVIGLKSLAFLRPKCDVAIK